MDPDFSHTLTEGRTGLPAALDALEARLGEFGLPVGATGAVMVAADEVLSNVLDHGDARTIRIHARSRDGRVTVEIADDGAPFDPLSAAAPDTTLPVELREIGGLGVHLVRNLMDEVGYERRDGENRLRFTKTFAAP
jgi:serine/threonine-protein kinase RsbW